MGACGSPHEPGLNMFQSPQCRQIHAATRWCTLGLPVPTRLGRQSSLEELKQPCPIHLRRCSHLLDCRPTCLTTSHIPLAFCQRPLPKVGSVRKLRDFLGSREPVLRSAPCSAFRLQPLL